ncbi:MAG: hypothetical protein DHS20C13_05140 [Thermodesulfobacteriota bacterium]|nr:MAG: hypothetical protein DHS20C13_05140 [Thermodesulfobacteriota bacterium]
MGNNSDYVKDIEKYFLSLAGKGIMLSSMDYSLILEWRNKEIPREVVLKGINRAFEESKLRDGQGECSIRNLKQCVQYIESSIDEFRPIIAKNKHADVSIEAEDTLAIVVDRLNKYIKSEKVESVKNYYLNIKESILTSATESSCDILTLCAEIEEESLEKFFVKLPEPQREQIYLEAKNALGNRARHMTNEALEESIFSFRNEILSEKYHLKHIFPFTEDKLD